MKSAEVVHSPPRAARVRRFASQAACEAVHTPRELRLDIWNVLGTIEFRIVKMEAEIRTQIPEIDQVYVTGGLAIHRVKFSD